MKYAVALALLMGCATTRPTTLADFTPDLLCYVQSQSPLEVERVNVGLEIQRRGYTCTQEDLNRGQVSYLHWKQIQQAQATAQRRALGDALIGIGAAAVIVAPAQTPVRCTTQQMGTRSETTCR